MDQASAKTKTSAVITSHYSVMVRGESDVHSHGDGWMYLYSQMGLKEDGKCLVRQHCGGQPTLMVAGFECWCMMLHTAGKHHVQDSTTVLRVVVSS